MLKNGRTLLRVLSTPVGTLTPSQRGIQTHEIVLPRRHKWNRTVSAMEKLVGFPTSILSVQTLMSDDVSSLAVHVRRLIGSDHPVMTTFKRMVFHERNRMQIRGMFALTLSRAANETNQLIKHESDFNEEFYVLERQRKLSEIVEMIYSAQCIHKSILNLPINIHEFAEGETKEDLQQLEYGNKIAILGGDYLLAHACTGLADLRNTQIVEMISVSIAEFTQAEFIGEKDTVGRPVPLSDELTLEAWKHRNGLSWGSLLANCCLGNMLIAKNPEHIQRSSHRIGHHLAMGLQAQLEIQPFTDGNDFHKGLDLTSAPIVFHLQDDQELLEYIQDRKKNLEQIDYKMISDIVKNKKDGIDQTHDLIQYHSDQICMELNENFPDGRAKELMIELVLCLKD